MKDNRKDGYPDDPAFDRAAQKVLENRKEDEKQAEEFLRALDDGLRKSEQQQNKENSTMIHTHYNHGFSWWHSTPQPQTRDFVLEVISKHPEFDGRKFASYRMEGLQTIGVFDKEPFEIHLHNNSNEDVSTIISLDGVNVLSGKEADLDPNKTQMWYIRAKNTLHLRAFHESVEGGSRFVFTSADKSVALHTTGSLSHKGIIAAAIFTEGDRGHWRSEMLLSDDLGSSGGSYSSGGAVGSAGIYTKSASFDTPKGGRRRISEAKNISNIGDDQPIACAAGADTLDFDLKREASVGAGEWVSQKTTTVSGLRKPILHSVVRMKYVWFDDLVAEMRKIPRFEDKHPTGFPGSKISSFADLSGVPKVESTAAKDNCVKDGVSRFA